MNISIYFNVTLLAMLLGQSCLADSGGGGGRIMIKISPYQNGSHQDPDAIRLVKKRSHKQRTVNLPRLGICRNASFYYGEYGNIIDTKNYIRGEDTRTGMYKRFYFGVIKSIKILELSLPDRIIIQVAVFPTIRPERLLANDLTYSKLVEEYSTQVEIRADINTYDTKGNRLKIGCIENQLPEKFIYFDELIPGDTLTFSYDFNDIKAPIWWAVDSIRNDEAYPYYLKKEFPVVPSIQ